MLVGCIFGWLCLTSQRQGGHLETVPPFTVPCVGRGTPLARPPLLHQKSGLSRGVASRQG